MREKLNFSDLTAQGQLLLRELFQARLQPGAGRGDLLAWYRVGSNSFRIAEWMKEFAEKTGSRLQTAVANEYREHVKAGIARNIGPFETMFRQLGQSGEIPVRRVETMIARLRSRAGLTAVVAAVGLGLAWEYLNGNSTLASSPDSRGQQTARTGTVPSALDAVRQLTDPAKSGLGVSPARNQTESTGPVQV